MLPFKFSPQRYVDQTYDELHEVYFEDLNDADITKRFKDVPEFFLMAIDEDFMEMPEFELAKKVAKVYEKFPWHFEVKREYFFSQQSIGNYLDFHTFFSAEIDCLLHGKDYGRIASDEEAIAMIYHIGKHFKEDGNKEALINIYNNVVCTQWPELYIELVTWILDQKEEDYAAIYGSLDEELVDWIFYQYKETLFKDIHYEPYDHNFYYLLNVGMGFFKAEKYNFDKAYKNEEIQHDILWLLKQGFLRAEQSDSFIQLDFINYALYLTATHEVKSLYSYFMTLYSSMKDGVHDIVIGDFALNIIGPAFVKIINTLHDADFEWLKEEGEENWYIRSIFLNFIASAYKSNSSDKLYKILKNIYEVYKQTNNYEMMGWWFGGLGEYDCNGFDDEVEEAFNNNWIDTSIFDTKAEWQKKEYTRPPIPLLNSFKELQFHAVESFLESEEATWEENLSSILSKYKSPYMELDDDLYETYEYDDDEYDDDEYDDSNIRPLWDYINIPYQREEPKVGRNDACPCGSGKKYKKCCGK